MPVEPCLANGINSRHECRKTCKLPSQNALRSGCIRLRGSNRSNCRRSRCDWPVVGASKNGQATVCLNSNGHLGPNKVEALSSQPTQQQVSARKADLRFWSTGNNRAVDISYNDITQPKRSTAALVALELRPSDCH